MIFYSRKTNSSILAGIAIACYIYVTIFFKQSYTLSVLAVSNNLIFVRNAIKHCGIHGKSPYIAVGGIWHVCREGQNSDRWQYCFSACNKFYFINPRASTAEHYTTRAVFPPGNLPPLSEFCFCKTVPCGISELWLHYTPGHIFIVNSFYVFVRKLLREKV